MRRIKQITGILLSWILLMGTFQILPVNIDGGKVFAAAVLSGDNSLSSLSISPGTLSPAFQYNVVEYTATVGADVTSVEVNANLSNDTATIESVSGNTDLKEGENLITIVVKAQNGTPATYKITVTKQAGGAQESQQPEDAAAGAPADGTSAEGQNAGGISINGHPFNLAPAILEELIPQDFTKTTVTCQGQEVDGLVFDKADLTLVYLTTPSLDVKNTLAVYEESGNFYPFRKIQLDEANYLILLDPPEETGLPEGYTKTAQAMGEYQNVPVYARGAVPEALQDADTAGDTEDAAGNEDAKDAANGTEFSLVYGVSSHGNKGWYQYDSVESTFQRYTPVAAAAEPVVPEPQTENGEPQPSAEMQSLQNAYTEMEAQYNSQKDISRKTTAVMAFVIAVLLVIVVNLLLRGRKSEEDEWEEDYDELSEKVKEQVKSVRRSRREGAVPGSDLSDNDESELWEEDTVPKAILRQQTKIIPELGKELTNSLELENEPEAETEPELEELRYQPGADKKYTLNDEKIPEPKADEFWGSGDGFDDDFEVINLEDL